MLGKTLEHAGWRQGSVIGENHLRALLNSIGRNDIDDNVLAIVASQSCDIANNNLDLDPYVEISIGRPIEKENPEYTYNKNPRKLHLSLSQRTERITVVSYQSVELKAYEKVKIPKNILCEYVPEKDQILENETLKSYVSWLSARYSRPALPTEFNDRVKKADPKRKFKKKAKSVHKSLSGIYVEIIPDEEIPENETYQVNLLGLATSGTEADRDDLIKSLTGFVEIMEAANMKVNLSVRFEREVSIEAIKRFKRFYYDDLSFRNESVLPPEVSHNL